MNKRTYIFGASQLTLEFGNITTSTAQVIVSSDDYYLSMGGGVSAAIRRAGGTAIVQDAAKKVPAKLGDVVVTTAGSLPADYVFHAITIGPGAEELSAEAVIDRTTRRCLDLLESLGLVSIAFPAIGAGAAGFSYTDVAAHMAEIIAAYLRSSKRALDVTIYLFDRFGKMSEIDYVMFFEEFRARLPEVTRHEAPSLARLSPADKPSDEPTGVSASPADPVTKQHGLLKQIAFLGDERDRLEEKLARVTGLKESGEPSGLRQRLREVQEERIKYLAELLCLRKEQVEVFVSYADVDADKVLWNELMKHLHILVRLGAITALHDRKITAGSEWKGQIDSHLNTARVILLLVSPDFMYSDDCNIEMKRALERHEAKEARVIPVILRHVYLKGAPFEKLQPLPKDARPVMDWPDRDAALTNIVEGIHAALQGSG